MRTSAVGRGLNSDHAMALATFVLGAWSQLVSRTRPERFENVIGLGAGAVALAVGLAWGGLV